jgi:protein involved in polysaccharide export with SLBB domain
LSKICRLAVNCFVTDKRFSSLRGTASACSRALFAGLLLVGCASDNSHKFTDLPDSTGYTQDTLRAGDSLSVTFADIPGGDGRMPMELKIDVDGKITVLHNQTFTVDGKTCAELAREIHDRLVPKYYVQLTVNVRSVGQFFYVDGEVKTPSRQAWLVPITVTQAIAACGGFTEFAKKSNVELIRVNGQKQTIDCKKVLKTPVLDLKVYPGDKVYVHRKLV